VAGRPVLSFRIYDSGVGCHAPCTPGGPLNARRVASDRVAGRPGSTAIVTEQGRVGEPLLHTRPVLPGGIVSRTRRCRAGPRKGGTVARIIVEVMLKPEIHDPQGEAILRACQRLGFGDVVAIRQGKRFEVELAGTADDTALARVGELAGELLANPVIEEFTFREA
jgi:phosphoribosylformylglycinamidine synthase subunit PurS